MNTMWLNHRMEQMEAYRRDFQPLMDQIKRNAKALGWTNSQTIMEIGREWRRYLGRFDREVRPKSC